MTRIVCTADLHENLIEIPECDVLLIAGGDISFAFKGDLRANRRSLRVRSGGGSIRCRRPRSCSWPATTTSPSKPGASPTGCAAATSRTRAPSLGLEIWGLPWTEASPWFHDWAFNAPRRHGELPRLKFEQIPAPNTDILICRKPPHGYGDQSGSSDGQPHVGSTALTEAIERIQPRLYGLRAHPLRLQHTGSARPRSSTPRTWTTTTAPPTRSSSSEIAL